MTVSQKRTNTLLAYAAIITIVAESILAYLTNFSLTEALVVSGLALALFSPPLAVYFLRPSSAFFAVTYMFVILSSASLYFEVEFTLYTTGVLCAETPLGLLLFREEHYPMLAPAGVVSLVANFLVIGGKCAREWTKTPCRMRARICILPSASA